VVRRFNVYEPRKYEFLESPPFLMIGLFAMGFRSSARAYDVVTRDTGLLMGGGLLVTSLRPRVFRRGGAPTDLISLTPRHPVTIRSAIRPISTSCPGAYESGWMTESAKRTECSSVTCYPRRTASRNSSQPTPPLRAERRLRLRPTARAVANNNCDQLRLTVRSARRLKGVNSPCLARNSAAKDRVMLSKA